MAHFFDILYMYVEFVENSLNLRFAEALENLRMLLV